MPSWSDGTMHANLELCHVSALNLYGWKPHEYIFIVVLKLVPKLILKICNSMYIIFI